jgi:hypothetical protein|mmetsp:Transcript_141782/g.200812  ORF Transcript_141782/g.200812 Transcript_141782/m.200812 type:complete len:87 (-) Transcript_141782:70-330(-)
MVKASTGLGVIGGFFAFINLFELWKGQYHYDALKNGEASRPLSTMEWKEEQRKTFGSEYRVLNRYFSVDRLQGGLAPDQKSSEGDE